MAEEFNPFPVSLQNNYEVCFGAFCVSVMEVIFNGGDVTYFHHHHVEVEDLIFYLFCCRNAGEGVVGFT